MSGNGQAATQRTLGTQYDARGLLDYALQEAGFAYQDFTDAERDCISRGIREKREEGIPQDQAIAASISICAPEKARPTKKSASSCEPCEATRYAAAPKTRELGGNFRAVQNANGSWNVFDVPLFCAHQVEMGDETLEIDKAWMTAAVQKADRRYREDYYLPPMHVNHHGTGREVRAAGFYRLKTVRKVPYEGKLVWTVFGDLIHVPENEYEEIRGGRLPYRSVEIFDLKAEEIDSLALMADEVPFFRLPLTTIGEEVTFQGRVGAAQRCATPPTIATRTFGTDGLALLYSARSVKSYYTAIGDRIRALREERGISLEDLAAQVSASVDKEFTASTVGQIERGEIEVPSDPAIGAFARAFGDVDKEDLLRLIPKGEEPLEEGRFAMPEENEKKMPEKAAAHRIGEDEDEEKKKGEKMNLDDEAREQILDLLRRLQDLVEGDPEAEAEEKEIEMGPAPVEMSATAKATRNGSSKGHKYSERELDLMAQKSAVDKRLEALESRQSRDDGVASILKDLEKDGHDPALYRTEIVEICQSDGVSAATMYAAALRRHVEPDPPSRLEAVGVGTATNQPAAAVYSHLGADGLAAAVKYAREYDTVKTALRGIDYSKEDYVASCMAGDGFDVPAPAAPKGE